MISQQKKQIMALQKKQKQKHSTPPNTKKKQKKNTTPSPRHIQRYHILRLCTILQLPSQLSFLQHRAQLLEAPRRIATQAAKNIGLEKGN